MDRNLLNQFKEFIFSCDSSYNLISTTKNSLSFKKEIPAQSPSCGVAGCLFLCGIVPGIIYYFLMKKDAKIYTLNFTIKNRNKYKITGNSPDKYKIENQFKKYNNTNIE